MVLAGTASANAATVPTLVHDVKTGSDPLGTRPLVSGEDSIQDYVQPDTQIEPSVAVNPANPANVVSVYQEGRIADGGDATNGFATSFDGGKTWTSGELPGLTTFKTQGGVFERASDAVVAFGPNNTAYANSLVFDMEGGGGLRSGMAVNVSKDGGRTWSAPVIFQDDRLGGLNDKNWIVVDNSDAPGHTKGRVYVVWDRVSPVVYDYCDQDCDQQANWLPNLQTIPGLVFPGQGIGAYPMVLKSGGLGIVMQTETDIGTPGADEPEPTPGENHQVFISAPSAGSTPYPAPLQFLPPVTIAANLSNGVPAQRASDGLPAAAVDDSTGALYAVWDDGSFRKDKKNDAVISKSTDEGQSWSLPQRVNLDPTNDGIDHYNVTVAAAGGLVHVAYRTRDESGAAPLFSPTIDTYYQESRDGGTSFSAPLKVNVTPSSAYYDAFSRDGSFEGDYNQTATVGGFTYIAREQGAPNSTAEPPALTKNSDTTVALTEAGKGHQHQTNWVALVRDLAPSSRTGSCFDRTPPVTALTRRNLKASRRLVRLHGRSRDVGCHTASGASLRGSVNRVFVSLAKVRGKGVGFNCRFVNARGRLTPTRNCRRPILLPAKGRESWSFSLPVHLPPGHYRIQVRAVDRARNKETPHGGRDILLFTIR
jgi:hypothetical protein